MNFTELALYKFIIVIIVIIHIIIINNNSTSCAIAVHFYFPRNYLWPQRYQDAKPFYSVQFGPAYQEIYSVLIGLFTDTAATLNLLDLRSIMWCPGGTRSVFTRAFRPKREL